MVEFNTSKISDDIHEKSNTRKNRAGKIVRRGYLQRDRGQYSISNYMNVCEHR